MSQSKRSLPNDRISENDPNFQVVEKPAASLLVGSLKAGFETVRVIGYSENLIGRAAGVWRRIKI